MAKPHPLAWYCSQPDSIGQDSVGQAGVTAWHKLVAQLLRHILPHSPDSKWSLSSYSSLTHKPPRNCTLPRSPSMGRTCKGLPSSEFVSVCLPGEASCAHPVGTCCFAGCQGCTPSASCCVALRWRTQHQWAGCLPVCPVRLTVLALPAARNFALIESQEVTFLPGLNVITGESGAGKSVLIEALGQVRPAMALMVGCLRQACWFSLKPKASWGQRQRR